MDFALSQFMSEDRIQTDTGTHAFLRRYLQGEVGEQGKVVLIKSENSLIIALGTIHQFHADIIKRACNELLDRDVIAETRNGEYSPLPNVTVQGAFFALRANGKCMLTGKSSMFDDFTDGIFKDSTSEVVKRFIENKVDEVTVSRNPVSLGDLLVPRKRAI